MPDDKPQTHSKHPVTYARDLNPDHMAGQNIGKGGPESEDRADYASEWKQVVSALSGFDMSELQQIPLLRAGARLRQGATYLDIRTPGALPFTATAEMRAPEGRWIVPKADTPYELWNRLLTRR